MTEKEFKILLDKFLNGKISPEEEDLLRIFEEEAIIQSKDDLFRSDLEKKEVKRNIYQRIKKQIKPNHHHFYKIGIAASIILLMGLSSILFLNRQEKNKDLIVSNTSNHIKTVLLTDGSTVILNKNSSLKYMNTFNDGTRYLELEGEAFFKVKRNEKKPFVVKTKTIKIKVLGTSFNVRDNVSEVKITVATGLVEVSDRNNKVLLKPDQSTKYKKATQSFSTENTPHELSVSWLKKTINLETVNMGQLAEFLKNNYGAEVKFLNDDMKKVQMSIVIKRNESLESILQKINYISELKLTIKENNMIEVK